MPGREVVHHAGMTVEEALRVVREKSALLRYVFDSASLNPEIMPPMVMQAIGSVCEEIHENAEKVKTVLPADAMNTEVDSRKRKRIVLR